MTQSLDLLDNIVWHTLAGTHAHLAVGTDQVRRYAAGYSPLIGARATDAPDLVALGEFCRPGEQFYLSGWTGDVPTGWRLDVDASMEQYVRLDPAVPEGAPDARRLGREHVPQALALVKRTLPGPFAERTIELGEFYGLFDGDQLVAMTGERMHAGALREVSAVCTHPDYQGRGLARRVMNEVIRRQLARGEVPFLHVMSANSAARRLYEMMGFRRHQTLSVRAVTFVGRG